MKTFKDLKFNQHSAYPHMNTQARLDFNNGYGVSVITGKGSYTETGQYEVAVFKGESLTYDTHITNDVIGYCDINKVTSIMKQVQELQEAE